jgi:hypothetical protein
MTHKFTAEDILPDCWFVEVPIKKMRATPFWINQEFEEDLRLGNKLLNGHEGPLDLGIVTDNSADPFMTLESWSQHNKKTYLKTEKFFNPYSVDIGSGRNAILGPLHYKGIGRNFAACRRDYVHSWGGMHHYEVLAEIFFERNLNSVMPEASVPLLGGFLYEDLDQSFLIRSSKFIRCEQLEVKLEAEEKNKVRDYLLSLFPNLEMIHQEVASRHIRLYQSGIYHRSPTMGNITVDGRLLDHYSLEIFRPCPQLKEGLSFEIHFVEPIETPLGPNELREHFLNSPYLKINHSMDYLIRQIAIVAHSLEGLDIKHLGFHETIDLVKSHFPLWCKYLVDMELRIAKYPELFRELLDSSEQIHLRQTKYGTVVFQVGQFLSHQCIPLIHHLLKVEGASSRKVGSSELKFIADTICEHYTGSKIENLNRLST